MTVQKSPGRLCLRTSAIATTGRSLSGRRVSLAGAAGAAGAAARPPPIGFSTRGPTLSPVSALCFWWLPSHIGKHLLLLRCVRQFPPG